MRARVPTREYALRLITALMATRSRRRRASRPPSSSAASGRRRRTRPRVTRDVEEETLQVDEEEDGLAVACEYVDEYGGVNDCVPGLISMLEALLPHAFGLLQLPQVQSLQLLFNWKRTLLNDFKYLAPYF